MARAYFMVAMACFFTVASAAEPTRFVPAFNYPVEHRGDIQALKDQAALNGYELQVVPADNNDENQQDVVEYDPTNVSILGLAWEYLPSPITAIKVVVTTILSKIWKIAKFLIPLELVLLGMGLVVGTCAFTSYCTLIIEEPIASKIWAVKESIPYIDELDYYVNEAIYRVQELQGY